MTTQIQIESSQRFTLLGKIGAWIFMLGPWVAGLGYYAIGRGNSANLASAYVVLILGATGFLLGFVFMLVGRQHKHEIRVGGERVEGS